MSNASVYTHEDIAQLQRRLAELEERHWESDRDLLLSEYEYSVPPSILRLARYIFDALRGRTVRLSDIREEMPESRIVRLSESQPESAQVPVEDMILAILEEVAAMTPNRPRVNLSEVAPHYTLRTSEHRMARDIVQRAERLAAERGIPFGEAVKQVAREL